MRLNDASWDHAGKRRLDFYESGGYIFIAFAVMSCIWLLRAHGFQLFHE